MGGGTTVAYQRRTDIVPWSQHFYNLQHLRHNTYTALVIYNSWTSLVSQHLYNSYSTSINISNSYTLYRTYITGDISSINTTGQDTRLWHIHCRSLGEEKSQFYCDVCQQGRDLLNWGAPPLIEEKPVISCIPI